MVHEIHDEKMSEYNVTFRLALQQKLTLVNLRFLVLCLTAITKRIINGKWFCCQYWNRKSFKKLKIKLEP